jgi:D-hexose-6-phosphate mutarotase
MLSFVPAGGRDLIFLSPNAHFIDGKAIRGGVPICWPWFNAHPTDATKPSHGFARTREWSLSDITSKLDGTICTRFSLAATPETEAFWAHSFKLDLTFEFGSSLAMKLTPINTGPEPWTFSAALHTYFAVSDVRQTSVHGLEHLKAIDTTPGGETYIQSGPVTFQQETDAIFQGEPSLIELHDPGWERIIQVRPQGSWSTVVWNPWSEKAARLADLGAANYTGFLCVETANIGANAITLAPGQSQAMALDCSVQSEA